jgi:hypothetical protein
MPTVLVPREGGGMAMRFKMSPDVVVSRTAPDELVLIHLQTDRIFVLNRTAARIWELLSDRHDEVAVTRRLTDEFEVTEPEIASEITELLATLTREALILPDD